MATKRKGQKIESLLVLWPRNGGMDVILCEYVGDDKIENLLNAEREGRLISDVDLGVSEEELEDLTELDVRNTNNDQRNDNKTGSTGKKNLEDAAETKQEGDKPNNSGQNNDKPNQQASYIPEFSPDSLINEIYEAITR